MQEKDLSRKFIETIPKAMWAIKREMRSQASIELTVPQFRILAHIFNHVASNVGHLSKHHGVNTASMSRMVDVLVKRGLITRKHDKTDRRQIQLLLSKKGATQFNALRTAALLEFETRFSILTAEEKQTLSQGLDILGKLFPGRNK